VHEPETALTERTQLTRSGVSAADAAAMHRAMREQSLRVAWRDLADACERLIEWRSFGLWARAIIDAECGLPEWLKDSVNQRCPGLFEDQRRSGHDSVWLDISAWADGRVFAGARDGGWLEALHYYSGTNPLSERMWRQWEHIESEWRTRKPERYPTFDEWQKEALKAFSATGEDQTAALVPQYIEWEAFAFWARSVVEVTHGIPVQVATELNTRCPGFLDQARETGISEADLGTRFWTELLAWIEAHVFADIAEGSALDILRGAARNHLRAERIAEFWAACNSRWNDRPPDSYPDFERWLKEADDYVRR
jgi:hypothetical protein